MSNIHRRNIHGRKYHRTHFSITVYVARTLQLRALLYRRFLLSWVSRYQKPAPAHVNQKRRDLAKKQFMNCCSVAVNFPSS